MGKGRQPQKEVSQPINLAIFSRKMREIFKNWTGALLGSADASQTNYFQSSNASNIKNLSISSLKSAQKVVTNDYTTDI